MNSAYLIITSPSGEKRVDLTRGYMWTVGRHEENDVVIPSDIVSRQHAMFQVAEDGTFYLIDMGSRNGSFVNGTRVSVPAALSDGDKISLGDTSIEFRRDASTTIRPRSRKLTGDTTVAYFASSRTTVLVVDVRNFTVLTQQIDQALLCQVIGTWFREAGPILNARGSWAQKYIGDAIMSVWVHKHGGQPQDVGREMTNILHALVELVRMTATLQKRFGLHLPIRIGAGINTGLASIGNAAGSGSLTDYTALGDTVNAAFRLESATKDADVDVLLGEESFEWLEKIAPARLHFKSHTVRLKGYDQPVAAWGAKFADLELLVEGLSQ